MVIIRKSIRILRLAIDRRSMDDRNAILGIKVNISRIYHSFFLPNEYWIICMNYMCRPLLQIVEQQQIEWCKWLYVYCYQWQEYNTIWYCENQAHKYIEYY